MSAEATLERLRDARLVAVLRTLEPGEAERAIDALLAGGVRCVEVTWTSPDPVEALHAVRAAHGPGLLLGAGTLTTPAAVEAAVDAGADFLVSPHLDPALLEAMLASERLALPGVFTPTEVAGALRAGASAVKLFPATLGGIAHLKALRGPFPDLRVVPTGGVNAGNAAQWLEAGALAVGAGSELAPRTAIAAGRWDEITAAARRFIDALSDPSQEGS